MIFYIITAVASAITIYCLIDIYRMKRKMKREEAEIKEGTEELLKRYQFLKPIHAYNRKKDEDNGTRRE